MREPEQQHQPHRTDRKAGDDDGGAERKAAMEEDRIDEHRDDQQDGGQMAGGAHDVPAQIDVPTCSRSRPRANTPPMTSNAASRIR